ncbi:MAG: SUF system NifU family Fe-S cluster assembly protein [Candidatus Woesearchaeota archaeon]|jgi:nitrogen fixation NifU-like protein|nr:SUF system NifU family Fe-S cluster assembly protein [archaeon]MDP7263819.1 SUF system NifU family Fe-S cluster assembly protein [Candidatus Woesearchaeota archaeon]MDP7622876.1 SUF system NifU family Fe-S cluster assembly protein [Candidatus Woesearchaeota archaeon]HJN56864.1 SUF system NifU family Fe-S cluster assembly protein [Candidatus Woesearchaeota archaeon]|tara:strand:+ start:15333 stop:15740 length:408 start_codon:yes stop_codon:yes gene_type:complete
MENIDPSYIGDGIYKENILDHYKHPHNKGTIEDANIKHTENNPLCGDIISVNLKVNGSKVKDIKFTGTGCAISQAAASMLTEEIKGKTLEEIKNLKTEDIVNMLGIEIGPVRTKCAVLSLVAVKQGIKEFESKKQ